MTSKEQPPDPISAEIQPIEGRERMAASVLQGLGFRVFRMGGATTVEAPAELWREIFGLEELADREVSVPEELADLVQKVALIRHRP